MWSAGSSRQVTGNQTNGDCGNLGNMQMNQAQVDPMTQAKVIDTSVQGSRDSLSDVMGDIIMPQADQTSELVQIASQQPSTVPSFHDQNLSPSHLQAMKIIEKAAPKERFSRKTNKMNYEKFMDDMEQDMSAEGITDELRVKNIDNWFSGDALKIVRSKKNNDVQIDATTLSNIKEVLDYFFKEKKDLMPKKCSRMWQKGN
jgi:hypothetical protein